MRRVGSRVVSLALAVVAVGSAPALAGDGTFSPAPGSPFPVSGVLTAVTVGDFNNDGREDLAATEQIGGIVTVALGKGDGSFEAAPGTPPTISDFPESIVTADFNSDGNEDLAVGGYQDMPHKLPILLGAGDGTFTTTLQDAPDNPLGLAVGDFSTGDPAIDLASADYGPTTSVRVGGDDGTFTQPAGSPYEAATDPSVVAVGDFNSDALEDIVTATHGGLTLLLGAADGSFTKAPTFKPDSGLLHTDSVAVGDVNSDGNDDLTVTGADNASKRRVAVLLGAGNSTFSKAPGTPFEFGLPPRSGTVGDFNSDGHEDFAVTDFSSDQIAVGLGKGDGSFENAPGSPLGAGGSPQTLAVGDFDADGNEDLAIADGGGGVTVLLGGGAPDGNLLVNGGAEAAKGSGAAAPHDYNVIAAPPGWTTTNGFTYLRYGVPPFPRRLLSPRWGGGEAFFAGGLTNTSSPSTASQTVSVADRATAIDAGRATAVLSGYLGGYKDADESIGATATFLDANGGTVGTPLAIGPVGTKELKKKTTFLRRSGSAPVPSGTRSIAVTLTATHISDIYTDAAYADRMGLFVTSGPEPTPPPGGGTPNPPGGNPNPTDRKAPQTKITKRPRNRVRSAKVVYRFKSSEKGSTFKCKRDKGKFKRCRSPLKLKHLKRGKHRFAVRATDKSGNTDKTPATDTFRRRR
jgi:hypothetical protein